MSDVTVQHLLQQVTLLEKGEDPKFSMRTWIGEEDCGTSHCLYGGAALLAGQSIDEISSGVPGDWDVGENTQTWKRLFYQSGLSQKQVVLLARSIKSGKFNLRGADLRGANFHRVDLSGADLSGADLTCTDLSGANLRGADLTRTGLIGTNLRGADLNGANLTGAIGLPV
jgi:hypothetical protein